MEVTQLVFPLRLSLSHMQREIKINAVELIIDAFDLWLYYWKWKQQKNSYTDSITNGDVHHYMSVSVYATYAVPYVPIPEIGELLQ